MGLRIELLRPDPDGVNDTFYVPFPYEPNSARLFVNGQLMYEPDDDGFLQSDPAGGEVVLSLVPLQGDRLQLLFDDLFVQGPTFTPILEFDVTITLSSPVGFLASEFGSVVTPRDFSISESIDIPPGNVAAFSVIDMESGPSAPAGVTCIDLEFVSAPQGFSLEVV